MLWRIIVPVVGIVMSYLVYYYRPEWSTTLLKESFNHLMSFNRHLKQTSYSYEPYATFVLQWPVSVCIFEVIQKRRDRGYSANPEQDCRFPSKQLSWTIHGIWNSRSSGSRCSSTLLKRSDIENVTFDLNQRWIQVRKYFDNFNFWEYEWNKHGTCLMDHPNLNSSSKYFQQAVNWHRQYDPTDALLACNMPPDDNKMYNNIKMTNCLKEHFNISSRIILATRNDNIYRTGTSLLRELRICFNKDFTLADCESSDPFSFDFIYPRTVENK